MTQPPAPSPHRPTTSPAGGNRILVILLVPLFMSLMSVSVVNVVLPAIEDGLGASSADLQWVLAGYALAFGVSLVAAGRAGDLWGRKPVFIAGILVFTAGSLASALSADPTLLNVSRVVTGLGSGLLNPQIIGIIQNVFHGRARGRAYGLFGTVIGLGVAIGPTMGGLILAALGPEWGWRMTFLVNVPIGLASAALAFYWLRSPGRDPAEVSARSLAALDPVGALLLASAVVGLMVPFILPGTWYLLAPAVLLLGLWWFWEQRMKARSAATGHEPMVDPSLFHIPSFSFSTVATAFFLGAMPGLWAVQAIVTQQGLGLSALAAGLTTLPASLGVMVLSPTIGSFVHRFGPVFVVVGTVVALTAVSLSGVAFHQIALGAWPYWSLAACMFLFGPAQALVMTSTQVLTMNDVPPRSAGAAGGVSQTAQRVLTAIGLAAVTGAFYSSLASSESAGGASAEAYGGAAVISVLVVLGFLLITLAAGVADLVRRHRNGTLSLEE
ncbi:MFS transporter [Citricoccus sp. GCM10030269]|uniref:MFS transporter n=1 Tax=Citricoccus sp. GCM10030269 TaxID=3273388 RepID=UPI00361A0220